MLILGIAVLFILVLRIPWVQNKITSKVTNYLSSRTESRVELERVFLTFRGDLALEGLYLEDLDQDTLVYSSSLELSVDLLPIVTENNIHIESIKWDGLRGKVTRSESGVFNFDFLINSFSTTGKDTLKAPKDSSNSPYAISLGTTSLNNFDLSYCDSLVGTKADLRLNNLTLVPVSTNLDSLEFKVESFKLNGANLSYLQFKQTPDTSSSPPPNFKLALGNGLITDVNIHYEAIPDSLTFKGEITNFLIDSLNFDLLKQRVSLKKLTLKNSDISLLSIPQPLNISEKAEKEEFVWPHWRMVAEEINLDKNNIAYSTSRDTNRSSTFDAKHITITESVFHLKNLKIDDYFVQSDIKRVSFKESPSFMLKNFSAFLELDKNTFSLQELNLLQNDNTLKGDLSLSYKTFQDFIDHPENSAFNINIPLFSISLKDVFYFDPELSENDYVKKMAQKSFSGNLDFTGDLKGLKTNESEILWGKNTSLTLKGVATNITDTDQLTVDFPVFTLSSVRRDIEPFLGLTTSSVKLPNHVKLTGLLKGSVNDIKTRFYLNSSYGKGYLQASYQEKNKPFYSANLELDQFEVGKLFRQEDLHQVTLSSFLTGTGLEPKTLTASFSTEVKSLIYNKHNYTSIKLNSSTKKGLLDFKLLSTDTILNFALSGNGDISSSNYSGDLDLVATHIDLTKLGVLEGDVSTKFRLKASGEGSTERTKLSAEIIEGLVLKDDLFYKLDEFNLNAVSSRDTTEIDIKSQLLDLDVAFNVDPSRVVSALQNRVDYYLSDTVALKRDTINHAVLRADLLVHESSLLKDVFFTDLKDLNPIHINLLLDENNNELSVAMEAPYIDYAGMKLDSLYLRAIGDTSNFNFDLSWKEVNLEPIAIKKLSLKGELDGRELKTELYNYNDKDTIAHIGSKLWMQEDSILLRIDTSNLILNRRAWALTPLNKISFAKQKIDFDAFSLKRKSQELTITSNIEGNTNEHLGFVFNGFRLKTFSSLLNPEKDLINGTTNGRIVLEKNNNSLGVLSDLEVQNLEVMETQLGLLKVNARSKTLVNYEFDMRLNGDLSNLTLVGDYNTSSATPDVNVNLELHRLSLEPLNKALEESISDAKGSMQGSISLIGTLEEPTVKGEMHFNGASLRVNTLNTQFTFPEESFRIDNDRVVFEQFRIEDEEKNRFDIDGIVGIKDYTNPTFDLSLIASGFKVLDSKKEDNELFYGRVTIDSKLKLNGDLNLPIVKGVLKVHKGSNLTFIVPQDELSVVEQEGVVVFVNKNDTLANKNDKNGSGTETLTGYDVNVDLKVSKGSEFKVVIDEKTGDHLNVAGDGNLKVALNPLGVTTLKGRYVISDGHYEASLYNLVNRRFELAKGGFIEWSGDPLKANLNLKAIYETETSAAGLMSTVTTTSGASLSSAYRQQLPFLVYLNIDGELLNPQLSFNLDLEKDKRDVLGGTVYGQLQLLNQQEEELNKQVFSLLVLNRFFPVSGTDGTEGGASSFARNNLNKLLSSQLNTISDKIISKTGTGIELDLGLESTSNGSETQAGTSLNVNAQKQFLNDRLTVKVGRETNIYSPPQSGASQNNTSAIGNITIEYELTEDGTYRIKGFRKNEFDSVIDGQLIVTGVALSFSREFNKFENLFEKAVQREIEKEKKEN